MIPELFIIVFSAIAKINCQMKHLETLGKRVSMKDCHGLWEWLWEIVWIKLITVIHCGQDHSLGKELWTVYQRKNPAEHKQADDQGTSSFLPALGCAHHVTACSSCCWYNFSTVKNYHLELWAKVSHLSPNFLVVWIFSHSKWNETTTVSISWSLYQVMLKTSISKKNS